MLKTSKNISLKTINFKIILLLFILSFFGCYPGIKKEATVSSEALEEITFFYPDFSDDMDRDSLMAAIRNSIEYLGRIPAGTLCTTDPTRLHRHRS